MTLKFGLLGVRRIGKVYTDAVAATPGAELVAVADALPEAAAFISNASGAEVRTIYEIMNAGDIDAVLITTPTALRSSPTRSSHADRGESHGASH